MRALLDFKVAHSPRERTMCGPKIECPHLSVVNLLKSLGTRRLAFGGPERLKIIGNCLLSCKHFVKTFSSAQRRPASRARSVDYRGRERIPDRGCYSTVPAVAILAGKLHFN